MHGMRDAGMVATAKHFPGHGAVVADSHLQMPVDRRALVDMEADLAPYRLLIENGLAGVMVSHGTDTLEETAWFLDLTVASEKPVVMVGAMRNASERDFDGPRNLANGARLCVSPEARGRGVLVALNGQVNAAREATKTHTSAVETFRSGSFGFLGVVDPDRVVFARMPSRRQHLPLADGPLPRVDVVAMYAGADGALLRAAIAAGAKGKVRRLRPCRVFGPCTKPQSTRNGFAPPSTRKHEPVTVPAAP